MKTDTLFYKIFQDFPQFFFELCRLPTTNTDWYTFTSVEVKQLAFRLDGLFLPTTDNPNLPSREEIETMLGLSELKQTKVYQEAFAEGEQMGLQRGEEIGRQIGQQEAKLQAISRRFSYGLAPEAIAHLLDLPLEIVIDTIHK